MFALSFTALFLEMMVIRWVPSVVHLVAYYANLMLLSSFLGLGAGAMAGGRRWNLLSWFPIFLACDIGMLLLDRNAVIGTSSGEARFFALPPTFLQAFVLVRIFAMNALLFVPLGQRMGVLFNALPRLSAYGWDLAGSLCGTLAFGFFSLKLFNPVLGMAGVMVIYLAISRLRRVWLSLPIFTAVLFVLVRTADPKATWSPYYYITVSRLHDPYVSVDPPRPEELKQHDPPVYLVRVNQFGYHYNAELDFSHYSPDNHEGVIIGLIGPQYRLPYRLVDRLDRVLIVGAGGGLDVEAALASGVKQVDAVEIDPTIIGISRRFNAGAPYFDPRVTVYIDDARSRLAKAKPGYDVVAFGYLDSQALFSTMNNVRLDGYVYTVESIRTAFGLLNDHGVLSLSFFLGRPWLGPKLYQLVAEATGREPAAYVTNGQALTLCVPKDPHEVLPAKAGLLHRISYGAMASVDLPTDDWPFLYLMGKMIPKDYLIGIGSLLGFSVVGIAGLRRASFGLSDIHFGLLGMGFLLLETKSIGDSTLFFGTTWFVTLIVVTGVLLMVISANFVAERLRRFSFWMYAPLFAVLAILLVVPREHVLGFEFAGRLLWTLLVVPLPVFFAGIIFSTTFRDAAEPSAAFGANLIGAMIGGFCEYLAMAVGNHRLSILVIVAYVGSLLALRVSRRLGLAA
ncbi:MAG TPA: hypothetical protein VGF85_02505 [Opitutaceae bacterium]|jgi:hypothetical protein